MSDIKKIRDNFIIKIKENLDINQINQIKSELFGKNGLVSSQFKKLSSIAENERKQFASDLNNVKNELQNLIVKKNPMNILKILDEKSRKMAQNLQKMNKKLKAKKKIDFL